MKRIATTAGCLALGAASLHAIYAPELTRIEAGKPWTVAASLRGFYDDNWAFRPDDELGQKDSWGFEVRPYIGLNFDLGATYVGLSYLNSSRFYEARHTRGEDEWDFSHQVDLKFDHQFSPRYRLKVIDSFLYTVYPDVQDIVTMPFRSDLGYYRNTAEANFTAELTPQMGFSLSYGNTFYDYTDKGPNSYSALLDRLEHRIPVDLRWQVQPDLVALVGYQFGMFDYTGNDDISDDVDLASSSRDAMTHAVYLGGDYDFSAQWRISLRAGAQYAIYDEFSDENQWTPYLDLFTSYFYTVGSHLDVGFKHTIAATDVSASMNGVPTLNQEVSSAYLRISHQFTPKLTANLLLQYQWTSFYGGYYDGENENLLLLSLYGAYQLNQFLSLEAGYSYDWLDSDVKFADTGDDARSYNRNYVFLGLRAQY